MVHQNIWHFICSILRHFIVPWSVHSCLAVSLLCRHHWRSDQCDNVNCGGSEDWGWCQWIFLRFGQGIGRHSDKTCGRSFGFCFRNGTNCQRHGQPKQQVFIQIFFFLLWKRTNLDELHVHCLLHGPFPTTGCQKKLVSKIYYKTESNFNKRQQQISLRLV